ncbi:MAG: hypothetical protein COV46_05250 [Deltaproteobacteria bacterium CG11_big_fil_rev_8_21_14_0_20_49_13]|nr:MAG: hypothetical protein COV46_05250 [Deltaproteobacteria bacterium CG11_big_fil_rev_8_21_14_0_20_49_13]
MKNRYYCIGGVILAVLISSGGAYYWYYSHNAGDSRTYALTHLRTPLYHCPMHPTYTSDKPGQCPICGMNLVPVILNEQSEVKDLPNTTEQGDFSPPEAAQNDKRADRTSVTISLDRQQLIGVKTDIIKKAGAIKEIRTVASVAFNPELAVAQTEYLEAKKMGDNSLASAAHDRLIILGMNDKEIKNLKKAQRGLFLPGKDALIYPIIYEYELPFVKTGGDVTVELPGNRTYKGIIRSIDTVIDPATRSARLHVEIKDVSDTLNPLSFGNAKIKIALGERLLVPKSAVISTGERNIIFMVHDGTHFMPMDIKLGAELEDNYVVEDGLSEGDTVVTSANFLIDSESKLKAAIGTAEGGGGHKH